MSVRYVVDDCPLSSYYYICFPSYTFFLLPSSSFLLLPPSSSFRSVWTAAPWLTGALFGLKNSGANFGLLILGTAAVEAALSDGLEPAIYALHPGTLHPGTLHPGTLHPGNSTGEGGGNGGNGSNGGNGGNGGSTPVYGAAYSAYSAASSAASGASAASSAGASTSTSCVAGIECFRTTHYVAAGLQAVGLVFAILLHVRRKVWIPRKEGDE